MNQNRNEWVIHIWGKNRENLELTDVEKFHIDMLKMFQNQQKRFDKILINIAVEDPKDKKIFNFLKNEVKKVIVNDNTIFKCCKNDPVLGEYVTFRPYVFDRIGEDVNIFYSHFKGYGSCVSVNKESFPRRVVDICEKFWSFLMYRYSMDFDDVQEKLKDKCVYCWYVLKRYKIYSDYYYEYQKLLNSGDIDFKKYVEDDLCKHSPGSFAWYNLKNLDQALKEKTEIRNVGDSFLMDNNLCTHFCELFIMQFLKEDDCYGVKDFNTEWTKIKNTVYTSIYPSKTIGTELIDEFTDYLIQHKQI